MRLIIVGLVILLMISCRKKAQEVPSFELIDLSYCNGWTDYYCLKVFNDGKTYVFNDRHRKGERYFRANLGKKEIDSVSTLVKVILSSKIDTLYKRLCCDCSYYNLIIKTNKGKKFKSFVDGVDYSNKSIDCMNKLTHYLCGIAGNARNSMDTLFIFESRRNEFYPPPPPPLRNRIKFTPPKVDE